MTSKRNSDPAGLKAFIEERCTQDAKGHTHYSGPTVVELAYRKMKVPRAYWILTYGPMPEHSFLVQSCDCPGCIDPDHWAPSRSPNELLPMAPESQIKNTTLELLRRIEGKLDKLLAMKDGEGDE